MRAYIVGGEETSIRQFPWQAGIIVEKKNFCGGSLITSSHVLTAAHCTDRYTRTRKIIISLQYVAL